MLLASEKKKREIIKHATFGSPLGPMSIAGTERGLCALWFGPADLLPTLHRRFAGAELTAAPADLGDYARSVLQYLNGERHTLELAIDVTGTEFQLQVWNELRRIPYGQTRTYGEIARLIDKPRAVRAVARACGSNPLSLVIPCHRVVASDGSLHGYRWGKERKQYLLELERKLPAQLKRSNV